MTSPAKKTATDHPEHSMTDPATRIRLIDWLRANGNDAIGLEGDTVEHLLRRVANASGAHGSVDRETGDVYLDGAAGEFCGWWRA